MIDRCHSGVDFCQIDSQQPTSCVYPKRTLVGERCVELTARQSTALIQMGDLVVLDSLQALLMGDPQRAVALDANLENAPIGEVRIVLPYCPANTPVRHVHHIPEC